MSLLPKLRTFVARCGAPAKFVAKTLLAVAVPGSGPVLDLIDKLIDCALDTAKDNLGALASAEDLQRIEKMFDVMLGDLQDVVEHLRHLEQVPDIARKTLYSALRTEEHCFAAAKALQQHGSQLSAVRADLAKLSAGQEDLRDLQLRSYGTMLDYIEEQRQQNVSPAQLNERLKRMEEALQALHGGQHDRAEVLLARECAAQPTSAALAVAEAAAQAAGHQFFRAAKTLGRAARLRPDDVRLGEMSRVATKYSQGATPVEPRPVAGKRPQAGDTLDGWLLERLLGFGGWGQVFLARKDGLVRALKIMHAELSQDAAFVSRFKREMSLLVALGVHPHLVCIDPNHLYGWAGDWSCWYYVMEYVKGVSLQRYLENQGALDLGQARALFTGLAEGLADAHKRGIVHRDIKPANILIRKDLEPGQGRGVLVDFGLAGVLDTHSRGAGYTALFAAPEQMRHGETDCRSDVYSLAATIYYCLLHKEADKRGRFKASLLPAETPAEVRDLFQNCLDNDPDERPPDAAAFLREWRQPGDIVTNSLGMKFAWIPPGTFHMGGEDDDKEKPILRVTLSRGFYMGVHPVTQAQWQAVMGSNPSEFPGQDHPVEGVTWDNCQNFCERLAKLMGKPVRLPTEAEWEYACRAGTATQYYSGDGKVALKKVGWYWDECRRSGTQPVGKLAPNAWGLYDMHGNVWEWCQDWFGAYPKGDVIDHIGSKESKRRVLRGGSWKKIAANCRAATRYSCTPACVFQHHCGCRVVFCPE